MRSIATSHQVKQFMAFIQLGRSGSSIKLGHFLEKRRKGVRENDTYEKESETVRKRDERESIEARKQAGR